MNKFNELNVEVNGMNCDIQGGGIEGRIVYHEDLSGYRYGTIIKDGVVKVFDNDDNEIKEIGFTYNEWNNFIVYIKDNQKKISLRGFSLDVSMMRDCKERQAIMVEDIITGLLEVDNTKEFIDFVTRTAEPRKIYTVGLSGMSYDTEASVRFYDEEENEIERIKGHRLMDQNRFYMLDGTQYCVNAIKAEGINKSVEISLKGEEHTNASVIDITLNTQNNSLERVKPIEWRECFGKYKETEEGKKVLRAISDEDLDSEVIQTQFAYAKAVLRLDEAVVNGDNSPETVTNILDVLDTELKEINQEVME